MSAVWIGGSPASSAVYPPVGMFGFRNRIINGDMRFDQSNLGAAISVTGGTNFFPVDRFIAQATNATASLQRNSAVLIGGFNSFLRWTTTVANAAPAASDVNVIRQNIEGFNIYDFLYGTSSAQPVALSFVVRSSIAGVFGAALYNNGFTRCYPFTFTVNQANTFEFKSVLIPGDVAGSWFTDNNIGLGVAWDMGSGANWQKPGVNTWTGQAFTPSVGVTARPAAVNGATFDITGVQLELSSGVQTSVLNYFDRRPYDLELMLARRYAQRVAELMNPNGNQFGFKYQTSTIDTILYYKQVMRANPTLVNNTITSWLASTPGGGSNAAAAFGLATGAFLTITGALTFGLVNPTVGSTILRASAATSFSGSNGEGVSVYYDPSANLVLRAEM